MLTRSRSNVDKLSSKDHNFDTLKVGQGQKRILLQNKIKDGLPELESKDSQRSEERNKQKRSAKMDFGELRKSLDKYQHKKDYWQEYQDKYGKLGISKDLEEESGANDVGQSSKVTAKRGQIDAQSGSVVEDGCQNAGAEDSMSKYLRKREGRVSSGRRSHSDLGFTISNRSEASVPTPRTAAVLANPALRKHIAKVIGVAEDKLAVDDFSWNFQNRMVKSMPSVSPRSTGIPKEKNSSKPIMKISVSDSNIGSYLKDVRPNPIGSARSQSEEDVNCTSQSEDRNLSPVPPLDLSGLCHTPRTVKGQKFNIPSFHEFKKMKQQTSPLPSTPLKSSCFDYNFMKENIIEEEKESDVIEEMGRPEVIQGQGQSLTLTKDTNDLKMSKLHSTRNVLYDSRKEHPTELNISKHSNPKAHDLELRKGQTQPSLGDSRSKHRKVTHQRRFMANSDGSCDEVDPVHKGQTNVKGRTVPKTYNEKDNANSCNKNFVISAENSRSSDAMDITKSKPLKPSSARNIKKNEESNGAYNTHNNPKSDYTSKSQKLPVSKKDDALSLKQIIERFEGMEVDEWGEGRVREEAKVKVPTDNDQGHCALDRNDSQRSSQKLRRSQAFLIKRPVISDDEKDTAAMDAKLKTSPRNHDDEEDEGIGTQVRLSIGDKSRSRSHSRTSLRHMMDDSSESEDPDTVISVKPQNEDQNEVTPVLRSTSDVSDIKAEERRKMKIKERRDKPYKSDPFHQSQRKRLTSARQEETIDQFTNDEIMDAAKLLSSRKSRCSGGAAKEEILAFLLDVKRSGLVDVDGGGEDSLESIYDDFSSDMAHGGGLSRNSSHSSWGRVRRFKESSGGGEVERVDSGVGSEIKESRKENTQQGLICEDCEKDLDLDIDLDEGQFVCSKCASRRVERKEALQEIVSTEVSYGKDLQIMKEEFLAPMKTAGLLNLEQLGTIFSNLEELISINDQFAEQLQDSLDLANEQGDEELSTVHMGRLFVEASSMLLAFETYCVQQASASALLEQLEREKELLRIFLQVSQAENSVLRRMNLRSYLMVPVQRVMKYPLLLNRLYKSTSPYHSDRDNIRKAQLKIEGILEHINNKTRGSSANLRLKRKLSGFKRTFSMTSVPVENIEVQKVGVEMLGWNRNDIDFVLTGKLMYTQPSDHLWAKKGKTLKFAPVHAMLATLGKPRASDWKDRQLFPRATGVKDAALVLLKEKAGKILPLRDPLYLQKCVVSTDGEFDEVFEVMDTNKEAYLLKGESPQETLEWLSNLRHQTRSLGQWRRRRNALPNIMIQKN